VFLCNYVSRFRCAETAIMAAWVQPGIAGLPAEITEEKLQEKGNRQ